MPRPSRSTVSKSEATPRSGPFFPVHFTPGIATAASRLSFPAYSLHQSRLRRLWLVRLFPYPVCWTWATCRTDALANLSLRIVNGRFGRSYQYRSTYQYRRVLEGDFVSSLLYLVFYQVASPSKSCLHFMESQPLSISQQMPWCS